MSGRARDYLILFAAIAIALCIGALVRQVAGMQWDAPIFVSALFIGAGAVKARWPANVTMRGYSWLYLVATFVLFAGIAVVLSDLSILRYWSIPGAICLFLIFCFVHMLFGPREDGERGR